MTILLLFKSSCAAIMAAYSAFLYKHFDKTHAKTESGNIYIAGAIGLVSNFFDALGIGSFATSTVMLRAFKQVPDRLIPGVLNVMCVLPSLTEAIIYTGFIDVDFLTLISFVAASAVGGWLGAKIIIKLPENKIRFAMSIALFIAGSVMLLRLLNLFPAAEGVATGLEGIKLVIGIVYSAIVGVLSSIGIGVFAPMLTLAFFVGLSAKSTFPIMMTIAAISSLSCATTYIRNKSYNQKVSIAMTVCGVFGVIVAAYIVKSLPLNVLNWLVMVVVFYSSISLFLNSLAFYKKNKSITECGCHL